ncbi:C2H2-type zinc finger protein [Microcoleus sp.]|uniref:C2H2-type zinc finger protein n=1 Tax=Microcoleus sp. TaxID=44472 RepID=UPI003C74E928
MSEKKYLCDQCNEPFGNPQALKFHKENKHFICGICGAKFNAFSAINQHKEMKHPKNG